jgi:hypothetical protein
VRPAPDGPRVGTRNGPNRSWDRPTANPPDCTATWIMRSEKLAVCRSADVVSVSEDTLGEETSRRSAAEHGEPEAAVDGERRVVVERLHHVLQGSAVIGHGQVVGVIVGALVLQCHVRHRRTFQEG